MNTFSNLRSLAVERYYLSWLTIKCQNDFPSGIVNGVSQNCLKLSKMKSNNLYPCFTILSCYLVPIDSRLIKIEIPKAICSRFIVQFLYSIYKNSIMIVKIYDVFSVYSNEMSVTFLQALIIIIKPFGILSEAFSYVSSGD